MSVGDTLRSLITLTLLRNNVGSLVRAMLVYSNTDLQAPITVPHSAVTGVPSYILFLGGSVQPWVPLAELLREVDENTATNLFLGHSSCCRFGILLNSSHLSLARISIFRRNLLIFRRCYFLNEPVVWFVRDLVIAL